ncbi:serine hydrolase domain-containing protein [Nocardiopsis oceani]
MRTRIRSRIIAATTAAAVLATGFAVRPQPPTLSAETTGDPGLIERAAPLLEADPRATAAVVEVGGDQTRGAYFGADGETAYEIGSISKAMTGLLLADAVERGEVTEDTELGSLLELGDAPAASVTLAELSSHRSGLPNMPPGLLSTARTLVEGMRGHDYFTADLETLQEQAAEADLTDRGEYEYSNFGTALLGQALATAAGTDYETLLRERLLEPLGLADTAFAATDADIPEAAATGYGRFGRPVPSEADPTEAGMSGVYSTGGDMGRFAHALLDGEAPGTGAMEPRWETGSDEVGLGWMVTDHDGTEVTWHNGMTNGFSAMLALDREADRAVIVLADSQVSVDQIALDLLEEA